MATSSTPTAAGTTIRAQSTAASTAAFQVAGPSTQEPIVEQLGQDTPSVTQGARPEQKHGSQPYFSGQQYTASRAQAKTQSQPQIFSEAEVNVEVNVDSSERSASMARARPKDQVTKKAKAKRAGSASTSQRSPSPKRDYPRGTCTVTRPSQASPRKAEHTVTPAQDLESFKADMTSMLSDMLQASFKKFASQFNTNSGGQGNNSNEDTVP